MRCDWSKRRLLVRAEYAVELCAEEIGYLTYLQACLVERDAELLVKMLIKPVLVT